MTTWVIPASVTGVTRLTFWPALLDSGLRRNDDSGENDGGAESTLYV